jgi:hypothetical protein
METKFKLIAAVALSAAALLSAGAVSAAPVTCPNPLTGTQNNTYTVDPATDCVWGDGVIGTGNPLNDDFLQGEGTNDAAYGDSGPTFGLSWTLVGANSNPGDPITGITFTNLTGTSADWAITDSQYANYALGVKDGAEPQWSVFLVDGLSGIISMTGGSFSHFVLYGSGTRQVPEPATIMLLGFGLLVGFAVMRRRKPIS